MEINGLAHVILSVREMDRSRRFYGALLAHLGLSRVVDTPEYLYYVGGRTAIGVRAVGPEWKDEPFVQARCGLHHLCFRARSREDVDSVHTVLLGMRAEIVHAPKESGWVPGYYSVLFEDPDGIRLEVNYVPGKGVFEENVQRIEQSEPR